MHRTTHLALAAQAAASQNQEQQPCLAAVFAQNLQSLALETHGLHLAPPRPPLADLLRQAATDAQPFTRHA